MADDYEALMRSMAVKAANRSGGIMTDDDYMSYMRERLWLYRRGLDTDPRGEQRGVVIWILRHAILEANAAWFGRRGSHKSGVTFVGLGASAWVDGAGDDIPVHEQAKVRAVAEGGVVGGEVMAVAARVLGGGREFEVLRRLLVDGDRNSELADEWGISRSMVSMMFKESVDRVRRAVRR